MLLAKCFGRLGTILGSRLKSLFISSLVVFGLSVAFLIIFPPGLRLGLDKGYTTKDAPSIRELNTQVDFFGNRGKPWYMAMFAEPRDVVKGSMIESGEFDEFKAFYRSIKKDIVIREQDNRTITYMDYCGNTCEINEQIFKTLSLAWFGLQWPQTSIFMYKSNIGKYFFLREMKGDDIVRSRLAALYFMVFVNSTQAANDMRHFEALVADYVAAHNANETKLTTITQHSARGMEMEIARGMKFVLVKLLAGVLLAVLVTLLSLMLLNKMYGCSNARVAILSFAAGAMPLMAMVSAMACCSFVGVHASTITFLSIVFTYTIGVDGTLALYCSWTAIRKSGEVKEHLSEVFASTLPSLTTISSTAVGLLIGGLFPIEEYAGLSLYLGFTLLFIYVYQISFITPVIAWCSPVESHLPLSQDASVTPKATQLPWFHTLSGRYAHCLSNSTWMKIFTISVFCLCLALPTYLGSKEVNANMDYRDLLPADSPKRKGVHLMSDIVWPEFFNVMFFIEKPPAFDDPLSYQRFKQLVSEIQSLPGAVNNSGMVWVNDFERHADMKGNETALNMTLFNEFITHNVYKAWNSGVKYRYEGERAIITRMFYIGAFENVKSLMDKAKLLTQCRKIAAKYPEMDIVPFDTEVDMMDVILQILPVTYIIPLFIFVTYALGTLFLLGNFAVSLVAVTSAAAIFLETYCIVSLMGMVLNPFSAAYLVIVAALSAKFSTHICHAFQQALVSNYHNNSEHRLADAFRRTLIPTLLSTLAGCVVFLPVITADVVIFRWLAIINVCCLICSVYHSLLLTPLLLVLIPETLTGRRFFCTATKNQSEVVMKNLNG